MKNLITILFLCITTQVFAFNTDSLNVETVTQEISNFTTDLDTSKVSHQVYNDVKSFVSSMAKGLGIAAEKVWDILVKQQYVKAVAYSASILSLLLSIIFLSINIRKADFNDFNKFAFLTIVNVVLSVVSTIVLMSSWHTIITGYLNPEYGALQDVIEYITMMKRGY